MEERPKVVRVGRIRGVTPALKIEREQLDKVNAELTVVDSGTEDEVIAAAKDADAILSGGAPMTRRVIEALPKCLVIVNYGVGYNTIDVDAATDNNIIVVNTPAPEWCVEEVSNHAIALLLMCAKKMALFNSWVKQGRWEECRANQAPMGSIHGQTLGLVGCGDIGSMTGRKAQCLHMKVLGYDPYVDKSRARENGITLVSLSQLLKESDYVSAHTLLNEETRHLFGENEFKQMKPSTYFINTSRGVVVDEPALVKALREKWIAGAGLDVFEHEPVNPDNPLLKMENVVVIPHSASYSDVAFRILSTMIGQEAARVLSGHWPKNPVNRIVKPKIALVEEIL